MAPCSVKGFCGQTSWCGLLLSLGSDPLSSLPCLLVQVWVSRHAWGSIALRDLLVLDRLLLLSFTVNKHAFTSNFLPQLSETRQAHCSQAVRGSVPDSRGPLRVKRVAHCYHSPLYLQEDDLKLVCRLPEEKVSRLKPGKPSGQKGFHTEEGYGRSLICSRNAFRERRPGGCRDHSLSHVEKAL
jgi:hypothetical protein